MEYQINNYLHIQQVKKLHNEIKIIQKHKREFKLQNQIDPMQRGILAREDKILDIIGIYDLKEYYYCIGNVEKLKKIIKKKEEQIESYFLQEEIDKYQIMIDHL